MKNLLTWVILLFANGISAQEIVDTTFFIGNRTVNSAYLSEYTRILKTTSQEGIYEYTEIWKNGSLKRTGYSLKNDSSFEKTGKEITYYKNGKIRREQYIENGKKVGKVFFYFADGNLKEVGEFLTGAYKYEAPYYKVIQVLDSLGNTFLDSSGTGKVNITFNNGNSRITEYVNGFKHGKSEEYFRASKITFIETYDNGVFMTGKSIDSLGKTIYYEALETLPKYEGGLSEFYAFIKENLKYPSKAEKQKIEGTVILKFAVEKSGHITDIQVVKGVPNHKEFEEEAVRIMRTSPKWNPGTRRGRAVRFYYSVPITFLLKQ